MLTVLGARKPLTPEVCLRNTTMRFIMIVLHASCCAPPSEFQAIMGIGLAIEAREFRDPTLRTECSLRGKMEV